MKTKYILLIWLLLISCNHTEQKKKELKVDTKRSITQYRCDYITEFQNLGNTKIDTQIINSRIIDPIDDTASFKKTVFGFVTNGSKVYKKFTTSRYCEGKRINVEYYQDFSGRIDLNTYNEYDDRYFTTKNEVFFWWVNSDGHLMIPINGADPASFEPFQNICGGKDLKGIYYGCPNFGVYQLNMPKNVDFEFIAKADNYWNSPKHFVKIGLYVYDVKLDVEKGYFIDLENTIPKNGLLKLKK